MNVLGGQLTVWKRIKVKLYSLKGNRGRKHKQRLKSAYIYNYNMGPVRLQSICERRGPLEEKGNSTQGRHAPEWQIRAGVLPASKVWRVARLITGKREEGGVIKRTEHKTTWDRRGEIRARKKGDKDPRLGRGEKFKRSAKGQTARLPY